MSSKQSPNEDVLVKKLWRQLRMNWRSPKQLEDEATSLIQSMPSDLTLQLRENRRDESLIHRLVGDFVTKTKMEQDLRLIETATRLIQGEGEFYRTHAATSRAKVDAARAQHEVKQVKKTLRREDQVGQL